MRDTEPLPVFIEPRVNRASEVFRTAAAQYNNRFSRPGAERFLLSYWIPAAGRSPEPDPDSANLRLLPASTYNQLESKASVHQLARLHGVEDLFPPTFTDVASALAQSGPVRTWFAKPAHLSGGRGITVLSGDDLPGYTLPPHTLLQAGVENLVLIDGRKFTVRIYLLLWNGCAYLFDDGFLVIHAPKYREGSTDYAVQVDHRGYQDASTGVTMHRISDHPKLGNFMQRTAAMMQRLAPVLAPCRDACDERHFLLPGVDLLVCRTGDLRCIEINAIPNFVHSAAINRTLNVPFFEQVMRMVTGCSSARLWKL